jgi:membrane associated rhomboid family serine protease
VAASEWIEVYTSRHAAACDERAFVLLALGVTSIMRATTDGFSLLVRPWDVARTAVELQRFGRERSAESVPSSVPLRLHAGALTSAGIYVLVIFLIAVASSRNVLSRDWYDAGVLDGARLHGGQWWRAVTALTLHADLAHLLGNAIFGALFGGLAARVYGPGVAWLLILVAAVIANGLNGLFMPPNRESFGASTAVFAALGALAVHQWPIRRAGSTGRMAGRGLFGALVLLGMLGTGDRHTDIAAHAWGFLCGALICLPLRNTTPPPGKTQALAAMSVIAVLVLAWICGLRAEV